MKRSFIFSINKTFSGLLFCVFMMLGVIGAHAQISVTATAGTPGPTAYTTLGAAFAAINGGIHGGAVTISVLSSTFEPAAATLNAPPGVGAPYTSVLIKPAAATTATITGNIGGSGTIYLLGATNVTIDGSNTAGGTTRDLTIGNDFTGGCASIRLSSPSALLGATNNTIKNCNIIGAAAASANSGTGIVSCSSATLYAHAEGPNSNNTVQNNAFSGMQGGIMASGPEPTLVPGSTVDANWVIKDNTFTGIFFNSIILFSSAAATISNNTITTSSVNGWGAVNGIELSWTINGCEITKNKIHDLRNTNTSLLPPLPGLPLPSTEGIYCDVVNSGAGININNNFISNITSFGFGPANIANTAQGLYIDAGGGYNIYHNTIRMGQDPLGGSFASIFGAVCFNTTPTGMPAGAVDLRDNILQNAQTFGARYCVYCAYTPAIFSLMDYNNYSNTAIGSFMGNVGGVDCTSLLDMITNFGGNVNSITLSPLYTGAGTGDLHLQFNTANFPLASGTPVTVLTDIDNFNRDPATPTMGAHELTNKIIYTPLASTCSQGDIILTVNVLSPVGINLAGPLVPRIYFQKNAGPWFSTPGTYLGGATDNSNWSLTISAATMGGVIGGDVISYYVVAQTTAATPTVFSYPQNGFAATSVTSITTPPTTPLTYNVNAVNLTGLTTSQQVCYNPVAAQVVSYPYTGSYGTPNTYTLTWSPAGPTAVPLPVPLSSPINASVPAGVGPGTFTGTITISNSVSGCSRVATVNVTVNPPPAPIGGPHLLCVGAAITLTNTSPGGVWSSIAPSIASVGPSTGIVTGASIGTTTISYTLPTTCAAFVTVSVTTPPGPITGTNVLCVGTHTLLSNATSGGTWSTSNAAVADVDPLTGDVLGTSYGVATISYNITGCASATRIVTVNNLPAPITGTFFTCEGATTTLHTTSTGGTWSSGTTGTGTATVGLTTGVVTGVTAGTVPVSYTYLATGCISVNTVNVLITPGAITGGPLVCEGQTITLSSASPLSGTWTSTAPGFVSVGLTSGIATGVTAGTSATITYMLPTGCYKTTVINVTTPPGTPGPGVTVCSGNSVNLSNSVGGGTWTSMNTSIATVDAVTGVVTGVTGGIVNIKYETDHCNPVTYTVTVNQTPPPITGVTNLCNGYTTVSTALSNPTPGGTWSICCGSAIITPTGLVFGLTLGSTNVVTYTMPNGCFVKTPIIVDTLPAPITGNDSICLYTSTTLHDITQDITPTGVWSSSNGTIASIIATTGEVYGASLGSVTITYSAISGCYRTKPLKVRTPLPSSVSFTYTPNLDTLCAGTPLTITAHPVNGGVLPSYRWQLFGVDVPGAASSSYTYVPTHGDVIGVFMTRDTTICSAPIDAHAALAINVYPDIITPSITISTASTTTTGHIGQDSVKIGYLGQVITFFSEVSSAGANIAYQWYVDGIAVPGATNSSYAREIYDNDTVFCSISGNPKCATSTIRSSNLIYIYGSWLGVSSAVSGNGSFTLFPNPNTGTFMLNGTVNNAGAANVTIDVTNVVGQVVYTGTAPVVNGKVSKQISLEHELAKGTYMLRVNAGEEVQVFHFVIGE